MKLEPYLSLKWVDRHFAASPKQEYLDALVEIYDLHEIIEWDILESSVQDKIDVYDNCLFLVLHFPKYKPERDKYITNEFNIIVGKDWIVTLTKYKTKRISFIKDAYIEQMKSNQQGDEFKRSPYYILYELIDEMYDKVLSWLRFFMKDLRCLEDNVFASHILKKDTLEQIMIKRRNIVALKHMLKPQSELLHELQHDNDIKHFWWDELEVYFEDLQYKLDRIMWQIMIIDEDIESLYDTYNAMVNMRTSTIITILTIFTAIIWVMTLVTGRYGMNVMLPWSDNPNIVIYIWGGMSLIALFLLMFSRWKKRL